MTLTRYFLSLLIIFFAHINLASAYYFPDVRFQSERVISFVVDFFEPFLRFLLGGDDWSGFLLFEKLLIFIILIVIIFISLRNIPIFEDQKKLCWAISIIVSLIGVRFIDYSWLETIILQYGVLAIILTSILPFIIFFFFVHNIGQDYPFLRKIGWFAFLLIYLGLWATVTNKTHSTIYFWTMIASFFALVLDGPINRYYNYIRMIQPSNDKWQEIAKLRKDIHETRTMVAAGHMNQKIGDKIIKDKEKRIKWLLKS